MTGAGQTPPGFPEYRASGRRQAGLGGLGGAAVGAAGAFAGLAGGSMPGWLVGVLAGAVVLLLGLMVFCGRRRATLTGPEHLTVQGVFGSRQVPWREIGAIRIITVGHGGPAAGGPVSYAVLYDARGRRVALPHLDSRVRVSLTADVAALRQLWRELRGDDWVPAPAATRRMERDERAKRLRARLLAVFACLLIGLVLGTVLLLVLVLNHALTGPYGLDRHTGFGALVRSPWLLVGGPAVLGAAGGCLLGGRAAGRAKGARGPGGHAPGAR